MEVHHRDAEAQRKLISIGYFEDFADPTLLIWGDQSGLVQFSVALKPAQNTKSVWSISGLPWITSGKNLKMSIEISDRDVGISAEKIGESTFFRWKLSVETAGIFAAQIEAVAKANQPCHQYLECDSMDDVVVMVSKGEYDDLHE